MLALKMMDHNVSILALFALFVLGDDLHWGTLASNVCRSIEGIGEFLCRE